MEFLKAQLASEQTLKAEVEAALGEEERTNKHKNKTEDIVVKYTCILAALVYQVSPTYGEDLTKGSK